MAQKPYIAAVVLSSVILSVAFTNNPVEAVKTLAPWIKHIHIKDALRTKVKGTWGAEVVWATGQVNAPEFLRTLKQIGFKGAIAVEREAGDDRIGDITTAINFLVNFNG